VLASGGQKSQDGPDVSSPPSEPKATRLLEFARALHRAGSFRDLIDIVGDEAKRELGYAHAWITVLDPVDPDLLRIVDASSPHRDHMFENAVKIPVAGDAMLEELFERRHPVVVEDARTDPRTNKEMVELFANRTIVNVPLMLIDTPMGALGVGTFGDEGTRAPSPMQLEYLVGMANHVSVAVNRIQYIEQSRIAERERRVLEARIAQIHRLESVGELAGGVAHDFNNLLTVILSSATMAKEGTSAADRESDLDAIIDAARRGHALTRQLLAMSRARPLSVGSFSPKERVAALVPLLGRMIPQSIVVDFIPHHHSGNIDADPTQFDQVLVNLAINARDAMPDGGRLTLEIEQVVINGAFQATHPWATPGRYVLVTVTDTGVGMTPEIVARAFEPFFTTKDPRRGTGLGLSVAHGIVRQHGGLLHCYSEPGVGTTFKTYWPLSERPATSVGTKLDGPIRGGNERILVAEDDSSVAAVARRILEHAGYTVTIVGDGRAACDAALREPFDLVVLDVVMPGLSAMAVLDELRARRPALRVLVASGYTADTNVAELLRRTSVISLSKPYDPDQLLRAVRRRLDGEP
jgi:signal transduction histidine kinase/BarA-like signal transduction histidine kinase